MADWEEELGLKNVRPFERPMTAGPNDKVVGQDELGQTIYETATGQRYSIRPATEEESKTTRAKVEDWFEKGAPLPSGEQVLETLKAMPQAAYESAASAVRGEGTVGDVIGAASTLAAPGVTRILDIPDETVLGMFGGKKATSPGFQRGYSPLPETVGADSKYRFEFSDKESTLIPANIDTVNTAKDNFDPTKRRSTLGEVLVHDELFYQYPDLANQKIIIDEALANSSTRGYYNSNTKILAISPDLLPENAKIGEDPDQLRKTLLHEIQHVIQEEEGFAGGTNPVSPEVLPKAQEIATARAEVGRKEKEKFEDELKAWEQFDWQQGYLDFENHLQKFVEGVGIDYNKLLQNNVNIVENPDLWSIQRQIRNAPDFFFKRVDDYNQGDKYARQFLNDDMLLALYQIAKVSEKDPSFSKSFLETFSVSPSEFLSFSGEESRNFLSQKGFAKEKPKGKFRYDTSDKITYFDQAEAYKRKRGEVEARNTANRVDLSVEDRFKNSPESTEDVPRELQWGEARFAEGGMVENIDPISGNEVPPGAQPEEVRDDVPIMASEGEYVIPANVVRYIGLDRIEKMVKQAKKGLEELDAEGRIGGEKATMDEDLPFSPEELMAVDEGAVALSPAPAMMAEGGMVVNNDMDIDPATGLPRWLLAMQNRTTTPAPAPTTTPTVPQSTEIAPKQEERSGRSEKPEPMVGLAKPVRDWTIEDYNKYGKFRNSVDSSVMKAATSIVPFGGLISGVAQRATERNVQKNLTEMLQTGRDLQGKPLSTEQLNTLRETFNKVTSEPLRRGTGLSGVASAIATETGLVKPKPANPERTARYNERVQRDGLLNRTIDFLSGESRPTKPTTSPLNLPAPGRCQALYVIFRFCKAMCF